MPKNEPTLTDVAQSVDGIKKFLEENVMDALRDHDRRFDVLEEGMGKVKNSFIEFKDWAVLHITNIENELHLITAKLAELEEKLEHFNPAEYEQVKKDVFELKIRLSRIEARLEK